MHNKTLLLIAVFMVPFVVVSFVFKQNETNFNLKTEKKYDSNITIDILKDEQVISLDLEEYIIGVVAAEMPASFNEEALKAQAVASRSYALYKKDTSNCHYDLTDDISTQVYISKEEMKNKWGEDYEKYYQKISNAVLETKGEVAKYDDEIIEALYFSMSSGKTQDAEMVFGEAQDYLKGVESEYDNETIKNYTVTKSFTIEEFKSLLGLNCENIVIENIVLNKSNYVEKITISNNEYSGIEVRNALSLRSAAFNIEVSDVISVTTIGYGHGVGMSQYGANGYAKAGYDYKEILNHYYKDIEIVKII